ncbi:MAG: N-acylneuraminate cytidylyltransferase [Bryobacterales bacterium]|nr:N-acylneuraminate cytidylyltransferase [Bryobacterales bacterium]
MILELSDILIHPSENLRTAMQRMTRNRLGILFACNEDGRLVGVLSDGDVRRCLLEGTLLVAPIDRVMNMDPVTATSADDAAEIFKRLAVMAIPIVDAEGRIREVVINNQEPALTLRPSEPASTSAEVIALIPARGGSKRINRKNLAVVAGRSLLEWSIQAAKESSRISRILVSTDDAEIAEAARKSGVEVPWMRPRHLSEDDTPTLAVLEHALAWSVENLDPAPEFGVLLEPTAPLRKGHHIDRALELLAGSDADCVMSVCEVPHVLNPEELLTVSGGLLRPYLPYRTLDSRRLRGKQSSVYVQNGLVYAFRIRSVLARHSLYGRKTIPLITRWEDFLDIDSPDDLRTAAARMERI